MRTRTRRQHTKSRRGCVECKRRHTKCDERRPVCSQCDKQSKRCEYVMNIVHGKSPAQSPASISDTSLNATGNGSDSLLNVNLLHAELLLDWNTNILGSFGWSNAVNAAWTSIFNRESLTHPFLMKGMLAMAACHISRTNENKRHYIKYAAELYGAALTEFRPHLETVQETNLVAAFAFSGIVQNMQMTLPLSDGIQTHNLLEAFLQYIPASRGPIWLIGPMFDFISMSELGPILDIGPVPTIRPHGFLQAHTRLKNLNKQRCAENTTYGEAIDQLPDLFARTTISYDTSFVPSMWGVFVPTEYVSLLERRESMALAIMAFVAVLYHYNTHKWYFKNIGRQLALLAYEGLDACWRPAIKWAMDEIGINLTHQAENPEDVSMQ